MPLRIGAIVEALGGELSGDAERVVTRLRRWSGPGPTS
jgi:hypothetical protein